MNKKSNLKNQKAMAVQHPFWETAVDYRDKEIQERMAKGWSYQDAAREVDRKMDTWKRNCGY